MAAALLIAVIAASNAASQTDDEDAPSDASKGNIVGNLFDSESGAPVKGATIILIGPVSPGESSPPQEVGVSNDGGAFRFFGVTPGFYNMNFVKSGYRTVTMTDFEVLAGQANYADFPLPATAVATREDIFDLDEWVVEASVVDDMIGGLELRVESDLQLNVMSADDLAKFSASDVADALKRVAGVNVVEGQFAIIRGLEDRYSSTLFNGAPVPSPDPLRQSVQLDLFPSEVVTDLAIAKTFGSELPSNSSGGSINVVTHGVSDDFIAKVKFGGGLNKYAYDGFEKYEPGSPIGRNVDGAKTYRGDVGGGVTGRFEWAGREFRYKGIVDHETSYKGERGFQEAREPKNAEIRRGRVNASGDLASGRLSLTNGRFDLESSDFSKQLTGYGGLGLDLDREANHRIETSFFYTRKNQEEIESKKNGYLPGFDYSDVIQATLDEEGVDYADFIDRATERSWIAGQRATREFSEEPPSRGPLWYTNFRESRAFESERDLMILQVNGDHEIDFVEGLSFDWAANYAETNQDLTAFGAKYFFEPDDTSPANVPTVFPVLASDLGPGRFAANSSVIFSANDVEETQEFGRIDVEYETDLHEDIEVRLNAGGWYEHAERDVVSSFLESPTSGATSQFAVLGDTPLELGLDLFDELDHTVEGDLSGLRESDTEAEREIAAVHAQAKGTFLEDIDVLAGVRVEKIEIDSINDPYTGEETFGAPQTFPSVYLFFDRLDNRDRGEVLRAPPDGTTFNDQLLGIDVPVENGIVDFLDRDAIDDIVNGHIKKTKVLPAFSVAYRPIEGLSLRASYSETVARPSFREMGFYVDVEPGKDDLVVGNPQLGLSDVRSIDVRAEYVWGDLGDLFAVSYFEKKIEDPIEKIVFRNPLNFEDSDLAIYRSFFNNPSDAKLWGIEVEARKSLDFLEFLGWEGVRYISFGGNYTYIDAKVDRIDVEGPRTESFFATVEGEEARFDGLEETRRLFGQPEWIANADVSFDHPDWGTKVTVAWFAISDVLDAAGSVFLRANGSVGSYTPDQYTDKFHTLDLTASQTWESDFLHGSVTLGFSAKNLTNSTRGIVYDREQTRRKISERRYKVGRSYKLSLSYSFY